MSLSTFKKLDKYRLSEKDWNIEDYNGNIIEMKNTAQSVISAFLIIENTLLNIGSPEETEMIDNTLDHLLECIEEHYRTMKNNLN